MRGSSDVISSSAPHPGHWVISFCITLVSATSAKHSGSGEALRFGYQFSPGYEVWVRGSLNQRQYFQVDNSGLDR